MTGRLTSEIEVITNLLKLKKPNVHKTRQNILNCLLEACVSLLY